MGKDNKALCVLASNVFLLPPCSGDLWPHRRLECSRPSTKLLAILPNKTEPAPWRWAVLPPVNPSGVDFCASMRGIRGTTTSRCHLVVLVA